MQSIISAHKKRSSWWKRYKTHHSSLLLAFFHLQLFKFKPTGKGEILESMIEDIEPTITTSEHFNYRDYLFVESRPPTHTCMYNTDSLTPIQQAEMDKIETRAGHFLPTRGSALSSTTMSTYFNSESHHGFREYLMWKCVTWIKASIVSINFIKFRTSSDHIKGISNLWF